MLRIAVRDLDRQVIFQNLTKVADGAGGYTETWADGPTVWVGIKAVKGREQNGQGIWQNSISYALVCRFEDYSPTVATRVKYVIDGQTVILQTGDFYEMDDSRKFYKVALTTIKNG